MGQIKVIKIGDRDVPMKSSGATLVIYRSVYGEDFLSMTQSKEVDPLIPLKIGFVMAKQAEGEKPDKLKNELNESDYFDWIDEFSTQELLDAAPAIMNVFYDQKKKKKKKNR